MTTLTVRPAQAAALAQAMADVERARQAAQTMLSVLCAGSDVPASATLQHIDPATGVLSFTSDDDGAARAD